MGAHVRLHEEPERHAWQAEVGTAAQPWLDDHQIHNVAALPGAAYCEMALGGGPHGARRGLRSPRHPLRADAAAGRGDTGRRHRDGGGPRCRHIRGGHRRGRGARRDGPPRSCTRRRTTNALRHDMAALLGGTTEPRWRGRDAAAGWPSAASSSARHSPD